ncbi:MULTISPECIES: hypothetical protein [Pseudomonas]|uniref:hypothetical protein n=1 Tax=Pseudomonas TaxID=286 RepID=UPI00210E5370|nr:MULTISPECIES: hypothetical protein [Pseudomonas]WSO26572.1 hypothetical protein VUJ50_11145 [Pseudomonas fluorescens]
MTPDEIEDTSDWLGSPTELETCQHYLRMLENEVQELTLQLRKAREDIFGLVQMHSAAADERDQLRTKVRLLESDLIDARREASNIESSSNTKLTAKDRIISELYATVVELTGVEPYTRLPGT